MNTNDSTDKPTQRHAALRWTLAAAVLGLSGMALDAHAQPHAPGPGHEAAPPAKRSTITVRGNGNACIAMKRGGFKNGTGLHLWKCSGSRANLEWQYDHKTGFIHAAHNKKMCLGKNGPTSANGTSVALMRCNGNAFNLAWKYEQRHGFIRWRQDPKMCLAKKHGHSKNGNPLHLWKCKNSGNLRWDISTKAGGDQGGPRTCTIKNVTAAFHHAKKKGYRFHCQTKGKGVGKHAKHKFGHNVIPSSNGLVCSVPNVARGRFKLYGSYFAGKRLRNGWELKSFDVRGEKMGFNTRVKDGIRFSSKARKKQNESFKAVVKSIKVENRNGGSCGANDRQLIKEIF